MAEIKDRRHADSSSRRKPPGEPASMVALFVTILVVSIGLALWADMNIGLRGLIAIVAGIAAAAITLTVVNRSVARVGRRDRTPQVTVPPTHPPEHDGQARVHQQQPGHPPYSD
ncbi:hypothetical protein [Arthrobacter sp. LAR12-1-1.1]|uniref:hypothetical protein n=1 Tax=Arthrobacter sp. LAR12-1-1.1 TaxID=3135215 RepID=UPI003431A9B8